MAVALCFYTRAHAVRHTERSKKESAAYSEGSDYAAVNSLGHVLFYVPAGAHGNGLTLNKGVAIWLIDKKCVNTTISSCVPGISRGKAGANACPL